MTPKPDDLGRVGPPLVSTLAVKDCERMLERQRKDHAEADRRKDAARAESERRWLRVVLFLAAIVGGVVGAKVKGFI